jgi:hypothetical protein
MNKSLIPNGDYCYRILSVDNRGRMKTHLCPYWKHRKEIDNMETGEHDYGYCLFLGKGDLELNDDVKYILSSPKNHPNCGKKMTANEIGISLSLLWDGVKMCNENMDDRD